MGGDGAQILWRRLDRPGHDACRLWKEGSLWRIEGMAVWLDPKGPAQIVYEVAVGEDWVTHSARLMGRVGKRAISLSIQRDTSGNWRMNGEAVPEVTGLPDIDLGLTPATNTLPLRRMRSRRMDAADLAAAWLDPTDWQLKPLPQRYEKLDDGRWRYASPSHDFQADLTIDADGFVTDYPSLWVKEG